MPANERICVLVVDDHSILRVGLKQVLESTGQYEVVGQAANGREAVRVAAAVAPDLVVMDVLMPGTDGVEACREIMATAPKTRVLMLTAATEETAVVDAVAAGATGYLQKETDREHFLSAVRDVVRGELRVPAAAIRRVLAENFRTDAADDAAQAAGLTTREREILVAFAQGRSYAAIAQARGVKPVTVRNAVYGIQRKLGVGSMQGLVLWAVRNGLLDEFAADVES